MSKSKKDLMMKGDIIPPGMGPGEPLHTHEKALADKAFF